MSAAVAESSNPVFRSRHFVATDPFERKWDVEFVWLQTGISIRHADTVDVRYRLVTEGETADKVIALPHPVLLELARQNNHELNDPWCMRLASSHLRQMIESWQDMDKTLVTLTAEELTAAAGRVKKIEALLAQRY